MQLTKTDFISHTYSFWFNSNMYNNNNYDLLYNISWYNNEIFHYGLIKNDLL